MKYFTFNLMNKNKTKGFTLIEFMVVIALIGIALLFIVTQFSDAGNERKSQTAIKNITQLTAVLASLKDRRHGYLGINDSVLLKTDKLPKGMIGVGVLKNIFNGTVAVSNVSSVSPYNNSYIYIEYAGLPLYACVDIAAKMLGASKINYTTSGVSIKRIGAGAWLNSTTLTNTAQNCGPSNNIIRFMFN